MVFGSAVDFVSFILLIILIVYKSNKRIRFSREVQKYFHSNDHIFVLLPTILWVKWNVENVMMPAVLVLVLYIGKIYVLILS